MLEKKIFLQNALFIEKLPAESSKESRKRGRPSAEFHVADERTKRRRTKELRLTRSTSELVHTARSSLRASGASAAATVLKDITTKSPQRAAKYQKAFKLTQLNLLQK